MNPPVPNDPGLPVNAALLQAIGDLTRWRILGELAGSSEPLMVLDVAKSLGVPATNVSKHLGILRRAGLVTQGRAQLYRLPARFLVPGQPGVVDLGPVVLRFGQEPSD